MDRILQQPEVIRAILLEYSPCRQQATVCTRPAGGASSRKSPSAAMQCRHTHPQPDEHGVRSPSRHSLGPEHHLERVVGVVGDRKPALSRLGRDVPGHQREVDLPAPASARQVR